MSPASGAARRLGVVVNPTAGKGRGARVGQAVLDELVAHGHDVYDLSGRNGDLALEHAHRAVADGLEALVVVGGDGMVHLGVQAVAGTGTPLGIVAVGTGNDFAATLGLPVADPAASGAALCAALDAGPAGVRTVDAVHVTGAGIPRPHDGAPHARWCAGALSAGLDASVNARANAMLHPRGSSRYTIAAVASILTYRPWSYTLRFEDVVDDGGLPLEPATLADQDRDGASGRHGRHGTWSGRAAMVTAANGPQIGGGIKVTPHASVTDGYLDVLVATDLTKIGAAAIFPTMFTGRHVARRKVHVVRARAVAIEPGPHAHDDGIPPMPAAFADGEHVGPLPLRAEARRQALAVLTPPPDA